MESDESLSGEDGVSTGSVAETGSAGASPDVLAGKTSARAAARHATRQPKAELLVGIEPDLMTLHTREAYWLFSGRRWKQDRPRILGGQRAAAALNELRHISVGGNPYADWFLLMFEDQLAKLRADQASIIRGYQQGIDDLKRKGLTLRVLESRDPLQLAVAFGSAYGYAIAEAIVEFDHFVRVLKTLVLKNRITVEVEHAEMRRVGRPLRRLFVRAIRWEHALRLSPWREIRRRDYLNFLDEAAKQRVSAAVERFGPLPESILSRQLLPRHFARRSGGLGEDMLSLRASKLAGANESPEQSLV